MELGNRPHSPLLLFLQVPLLLHRWSEVSLVQTLFFFLISSSMMRPLFGQIYQAQPYRQVMSPSPKGCWTTVSALQFLTNYYCMLTPLTVHAFWLRWHLPLALGSKLPCSNLGLRLGNNELRIAVGLRLGGITRSSSQMRVWIRSRTKRSPRPLLPPKCRPS